MRAKPSADTITVGIVGGSGLYELEGLEDARWVKVSTPFGAPSDAYRVGRLGATRVIFLARHGRGHRLGPSDLNYRANIYGFKVLGAGWVISASAVGSMREHIHPLDLVIPDQLYDHTKRRTPTFFGDGIVAHVGMADPVCRELGALLATAAEETGVTVHRGGTYLCMEGPQFSTRAESQIYRDWGISVIGMTNMPEAKLAREAELCYATMALVTDYDTWHAEHESVTVESVIANLTKNVETARQVLARAVPRIGKPCTAGCRDALANAVITNPRVFPPRTRKRLALLLDRYFPARPRRRARG